MSVHVLSWALSQVKQGHRVAIATIVSAKGSVPGKPGAKLAIIQKCTWYCWRCRIRIKD